MTAIAISATSQVYRNSASARLIERTTTASVALLAGIAALVSYGHMHALAMQHGEGWLASALIPLSVDGMIVASSMSLLLDSRLGRRGGVLPWTLLITGAAASLAANIAVAEPALLGRVIAAWPSFALTASYELLMRQVRHAAQSCRQAAARGAEPALLGAATPGEPAPLPPAAGTGSGAEDTGTGSRYRVLQRQAWQWALANRRPDGSLPAGAQVARQFDRSDRWGRLVTGLGRAGQLTPHADTMTAPLQPARPGPDVSPLPAARPKQRPDTAQRNHGRPAHRPRPATTVNDRPHTYSRSVSPHHSWVVAAWRVRI